MLNPQFELGSVLTVHTVAQAMTHGGGGVLLMDADVLYDTIGESVGFFRFNPAGARRLAALVAGYVESGRAGMPHEEAVRDLLRERSQTFEVSDVTGAPWIEIDFPTDVIRAAHEVLPQLQPLSE